jgi:hypothetical protein
VNAHDRYDELAVGHALDALEPQDEAAFLAHVRGCDTCARAVAEHRATLGHLAHAVPSLEPPAALIEGIRAGVEASGRAGSFPAPASLAERRGRTVKLTTVLVGVAASAVLVVALALVDLNLHSSNSDLRQQEAAFRRTVSSLLTSGAQRIQLTGDGNAVAVVHGGQVDLVLSGVPANDSRSTYVLWQQNARGITAAGAFDVRSTGLTVVSRGLRVDVGATLKALMVTREQGRVPPATAHGPLVFRGAA